MVEKDDDLVIDEEVDNTEEVVEEVIENPESSEQTDNESESEPATIQDEEDDEDEEDRIVTIGDEPPETEAEGNASDDENQETPGWVKKVRKVNRKLESEVKRKDREIEKLKQELKSPAQVEKPVELGEEPTLKSSGYDDNKFKQALRAYDERKRKVEEQASERAKVEEQRNEKYRKRTEKYVALKEEHSFKDFEGSEETVKDTFSQLQQSIIVQGADDSALLVYALGKNPKKLEELSKISDPVEFAFKVAKLESQLKVTNKKAPKPEARVKTGKSGGISGSVDKTLERLRDDAAKTGDFSKVLAYKKQLRKG